MSKFKFVKEDFTKGDSECVYWVSEPQALANTANAKIASLLARLKELEAMIENAPVVYGFIDKNDEGKPVIHFYGSENNCGGDTHKARLVCIEPVKKDETE